MRAELKRRYFPAANNWTIQQGSVLDDAYVERLGFFDVVYSWGVLHHTGKLWHALANAARPVEPGGRLFIAVYRDQGWLSGLWLSVKKLYNSSAVGRGAVLGTCLPLVWVLGFFGDLARGRNPFAPGKPQDRSRGISRLHDWVDWLGAAAVRGRVRVGRARLLHAAAVSTGEPRPEPRPRLQRIRVLACGDDAAVAPARAGEGDIAAMARVKVSCSGLPAEATPCAG